MKKKVVYIILAISLSLPFVIDALSKPLPPVPVTIHL